MAKSPAPQQWPPYPHIPIFLETSDGNGTSRSYGTISPVSPCPEFRPQKRSVQYLAAASTQFTNIPTTISTNISPVSPATQFTNLSPIWPIPEPPPEIVPSQPKRPALRFFPTAKPRLQLERPPLAKVNTVEEKRPHPGTKSELGLGIQDASAPHRSKSSATQTAHPSAARHSNPSISNLSIVDEKAEPPQNIAQRIEQKLWRYSSSGNIIKRWLLEIISWWISALSMAAIIGVLIFYQNKSKPQWPGGLTLNTFIAVMSKISGAALILPVSEGLGQLKWSWFRGDSKKMWDFEIFDNASRGPWGSFLLLIRTKGKALAALGALVTLFSLALDPFFQQVVDFPDRWSLRGSSSIPRVVRYEPRYGVEYKNSVEINRQDIDIRAVAEKFFYDNGTQPMTLGNGTRPEIPLSCPTSNCTWPQYETLAVCNKCADISDLLEFGCFETTVDWISSLKGVGSEWTYPNGTMCGYFLNKTLMSGYSLDADKPWANQVLLTRALPLVTNPNRTALYGNGSINFKEIRNSIMDVVLVSAKDGSVDSVHRNETPVALECVLSWCVQTLNSSYSYGMYEEQVLRSVFNDTQGPFPWVSKPFISPQVNGTQLFYTEDPIIDPSEKGINDSATYGVSSLTHRYTGFIFDDIFPSWTTVANSSAPPLLRFKFNIAAATNTKTLIFNPWLQSTNVTAHMERLALAITNAIRSSSSKEMISGDAYDSESFVAVRWQWLSLPLGLLFLSAFFLLATISKTAKEKDEVGVWKTSAIATLLYGLPDDMQRKINNAEGSGTPRAKAKQLRVKLLPKKGWRASGNPFSPLTPKIRRNSPQQPAWI